MLGPFAARNAGGDDGVPQSGAIQVHEQAVPPRPTANGGDLVQWINTTPASVVRVLQRDKSSPDLVIVDRSNLVLELAEIEDAVVAFDGSASDAAERSRSAGLININVAT